jgi:hypothetical protein
VDWLQLTSNKNVAGSISNWLNNAQVTAGTGGVADTLLQEAMDWITGSGLKHWRMIPPPVSGTMTIGNPYVSQPADFYEPNIFYITGIYQQPMVQKTPQEVIANYSYDGNGVRINQQPVMYYFDQTYLQFDSPPDQSYPYILVYYQNIPALSATNTTNFLTTYYSRLVRAAVMCIASEWAKDSGTGAYDRTYWAEMADKEQQGAQADSDRAHRATEFAWQEIGGNAAGFEPYGYY